METSDKGRTLEFRSKRGQSSMNFYHEAVSRIPLYLKQVTR